MKAIETSYKGYHFRSRLEARYAVFFDALGLAWEYEPEGFELRTGQWYLPDFRVTYPGRDDGEIHNCWFEVKGNMRDVTHDDWKKMLAFQSTIACKEAETFVILDGTPDCRMYLEPIFWVVTGKNGRPIEPFTVHPDALKFNRAGNALWHYKGRLWWDDYENFFGDYDNDNFEVEALMNAVQAARSARFEHGAQP